MSPVRISSLLVLLQGLMEESVEGGATRNNRCNFCLISRYIASMESTRIGSSSSKDNFGRTSHYAIEHIEEGNNWDMMVLVFVPFVLNTILRFQCRISRLMSSSFSQFSLSV